MIKVIYILSDIPAYFSINENNMPKHYFINNNNSRVGVFEGEWGNQIGNQLMKYSDNILFEFWRPDLRADKVYKKKFENGLVHIVFPAKQLSKGVYSQQIIDEINKEIRNNQLVLDIGIKKSLINEAIIENFNNQVPIINHSLGNLSFINLSLSRNFFKWISSYKRHKEIINYIINKQKYISIHEYLPLEEEFRKKVIFENHHLLHHAIGIDEAYFDMDFDKTQMKRKLELPLDKKIFFSSSRLDSLKQLDKMIYAFSKVQSNDFTLIISGKGSKGYQNYLNKIINKQSKDIRFIGYLKEQELIDYYKASDYFIDASRNDGGPTSAWKAMGLKVRVITTATGNVGVFLKKYQAGCFIPPRDSKKWTKVFEDIIKGSKEVKNPPIEKVKEFCHWPLCIQKNINNYKFVTKNFYGE